MGLFNRLFGTPTPKAPPTPPVAVKRPPQKPAEKATEKPQTVPATAPAMRGETTAVDAPAAEKETAAMRDDEAAAAEMHAPAAHETFEPATEESSSQEAAAEEDVPETASFEKKTEAAKEDDRFAPEEVSADAIDTNDVTVESVEAAVSADAPTKFVAEAAALPGENAAANENAATDGTTADVKPAAAPVISEHLQKRLDTYFARLRQDFPDGCITRLNTAHKKLAERGAELRRLIGYEGRLDEFFALGGFTYRRGTSGRPSLPAEQTASVEERLRQQFPEDVPTLLAVQQADHRLYLDLRAAARRAGCTVGEYLDQFRAG